MGIEAWKVGQGLWLRTTLLISIAVLVSKMLGLVRQQLLFSFLGIGPVADAFFSGIRLSGSLRELLAEGALSSVMVVVVSQALASKSRDDAHHVARYISFLSFIVVSFISLLIIFLGEEIINLYHNDNMYSYVAVDVLIFSIPFLLIMSLSATAMGFLNSHNVYSWSSWAPVVFNIFFIFSSLYFFDLLGVNGIVIAMIVGACSQFFIQFIPAHRMGWRFSLSSYGNWLDIRKFFILFWPMLLVMGSSRIYGFIWNGVATSGTYGVNSSLSFAYFLVNVPISIFVVGISLVSQTNLSILFTKRNYITFYRSLVHGQYQALMLCVPCFVGMISMSDSICLWIYKDIIYMGGATSSHGDILSISSVFFVYSFSLIPLTLSVLYARAFQSMIIWIYPLFISLLCLALFSFSIFFVFDFISNISLLISWSFVGALVLSCILQGISIRRILFKKGITVPKSSIIFVIFRYVCFSSIIFIFGSLYEHLLIDYDSLRWFMTPLAVLMCAFSYFFLLYLFKDPLFRRVIKLFR